MCKKLIAFRETGKRLETKGGTEKREFGRKGRILVTRVTAKREWERKRNGKTARGAKRVGKERVGRLSPAQGLLAFLREVCTKGGSTGGRIGCYCCCCCSRSSGLQDGAGFSQRQTPTLAEQSKTACLWLGGGLRGLSCLQFLIAGFTIGGDCGGGCFLLSLFARRIRVLFVLSGRFCKW